MTTIKRLSLIIAFTLAGTLLCAAQEQPKEAATDSQTTVNAADTIIGEGTPGKLPKFTGTHEIGDSVILESSGRVGVNTPGTPAAKLHIHQPQLGAQRGDGTDATPLLRTSGGKGGSTSGIAEGQQVAGTGASIYLFAGPGGDAPSGSVRGNGGSITLQPGRRGLGEGLHGSPGKVLIAPNGFGNVGIGTFNTGLGKVNIVSDEVGVFVNAGGIGLSVHGGSVGLHSESTHGTGITGSTASGVGVFGLSTSGAAVHGNSFSGHAGLFDGKVLVRGELTVAGNVCAANISCASDARLKQNVLNLRYGLSHLLRLRPVSWNWKAEPKGKLQLGLVAQEVEPVMPELVLREADAARPLGLNYMALLPVVVKAIQEQQRELEGKEAEIKALRRENEAIKARLDALELALRKPASN